jgi:NADH:ubiquinone oxidoreductase subunit 5 (subunit L)/multisubunit Na+/H+ antiporter MnhA subunit
MIFGQMAISVKWFSVNRFSVKRFSVKWLKPKIIVLVICIIIIINPYAANFDLPERKCSNGLFRLFFGYLLLFSSKFSTLVTSKKNVLLFAWH